MDIGPFVEIDMLAFLYIYKMRSERWKVKVLILNEIHTHTHTHGPSHTALYSYFQFLKTNR